MIKRYFTLIKTGILFFAGGTIGYAGGYWNAGSQLVPQLSQDTMVLLTANKTAQQTAERFFGLLTQYETLLANMQKTSMDSSKSHSDFFAKLTQTIDHIKVSTVSENTQILTTSNPVTSETQNQSQECTEVEAKLDYQAFQETLTDMQSTDFETRRKALSALVLMGSREIKEQIGQLILNEEEDITLRRSLIQTMDWRGLGNQLTQLFEDSKSPEIRAATILAAQTSRLLPEERQMFSVNLTQKFADESEDTIKIFTLDYFANTDPDQLHTLIQSVHEGGLSPIVREHIQRLTTPPVEPMVVTEGESR